MAILTGRTRHYDPSEIIVAQPDLKQVLGELERLGIHKYQKDAHQRLGLALLALPQLDEDIRRLRQDPSHADLIRDASAAWQLGAAADTQTGEIPNLDLLMSAVRTYFGDRFRGWVPTMGKNRTVQHPGLEGFPHVRGGGEGDPTQGDGQDTPWPPRGSEPGAGVQVGLLDTKLRSSLAGFSSGRPGRDSRCGRCWTTTRSAMCGTRPSTSRTSPHPA